MEPVATHPSGMAEPTAYDPTSFASSSRAGPLFGKCIAVASAQGPSKPPLLQEQSEEKNPQPSRQQETLAASASQSENSKEATSAVPGLDEFPEPASMKAVPEVRQAFGAPAEQAKYPAELGNFPPAVLSGLSTQHPSPEIPPGAVSEVLTQQQSQKSPDINQHASTDEIAESASPASSSADAPGSEYDDFEGFDVASHTAPLQEPQQERSPTPYPENQRVSGMAEPHAPPNRKFSEAQSFSEQPGVTQKDGEILPTAEIKQAVVTTEKQYQFSADTEKQISGAAENVEKQQSEFEKEQQEPLQTENDERHSSEAVAEDQGQPAELQSEISEEQQVVQLLPAAIEMNEKVAESDKVAQVVKGKPEDQAGQDVGIAEEDATEKHVAEDDGAEDNVAEGSSNVSLPPSRAPVASSMEAPAPAESVAGEENSDQVTQQIDIDQNRCNEGWTLKISALLDQVEAQSEPIQNERITVTEGMATENSEPPAAYQREPVSVEDEKDASSLPPNTLIRPAEEEAGASPKRQKFSEEDAALAEETRLVEPEAAALPVPPETQLAPEVSQPGSAPKTKAPENKAAAKPKPASKAKALPKPKAPPKLKEPKAKGKKASGQPEVAIAEATENPQPAVQLPPAMQLPLPMTDPSPERIAASEAEAIEPKPKKARRAPARPRKKAASVDSALQEAPQTAPPPQSHAEILDPRLIEAPSAPAADQPAHPETASTEPASKGKSKAAAKPRSPSKAKAKAKAAAESSLPAEAIVAASAEPVTKPKPAAKRAAAKKAKGPVAKMLPAQEEDAVSELELEPPQNPKVLATSPRHIEAAQGGAMISVEKMSRTSVQGEYEHSIFLQADESMTDEQHQQQHQQRFFRPPPPLPGESGHHSGDYTSSNIFTSMPPPLYPAQAYYPTRAQLVQQQQHDRGLSSLSNVASLLESETHWSESSVARPGSALSEYEGANELTSPTTMTNTAGSVAGDATSDTTSLSQDHSLGMIELDPRIYPPGWRLPYFDLMDPDQLMTSMRERTVWTFWDCYLPLGCRDQDMVLQSNDGVAFPCAAWNPCLFSKLLNRVISNPSRGIRQIMQRGAEGNRKMLGYSPLPCVVIDENWHATNLLLSFLHPIPNMFLPDVATCRVVLDVGMKYGVDRAINMATQRLNQLDEEDRVKKGKGKARSTEEEIAADLAERAAEAASQR